MDSNTKTSPPVDYVAVLADMKKKRAVLDKGIAAVEVILGMSPSIDVPTGEIITAGQELKVNVAELPIASDAFFGLTIPAAAKKYLEMTKKPQRTKDIAQALLTGGMQHRSGNFENTVGSILNRNGDESTGIFAKLKRGTWGLRTWYKQGAAVSQ
jgi:hypothetical protein